MGKLINWIETKILGFSVDSKLRQSKTLLKKGRKSEAIEKLKQASSMLDEIEARSDILRLRSIKNISSIFTQLENIDFENFCKKLTDKEITDEMIMQQVLFSKFKELYDNMLDEMN